MEDEVTILGAGPAGLFAALAAAQAGKYINIIAASDEPSPVGGAQYLHEPIPELTDDIDPTMLTYVKVGDMDGYAFKAYGEEKAQVSWDTFVTGEYPAWNLRGLYLLLWERFSNIIQKRELGASDIDLICLGTKGPVFSSIPLDRICKDPIAHDFQGQQVAFTHEPFVQVPEMIVYNGRASDSWYRAACLFGECSAEYAVHGDDRILEGKDIVFRGIKPTLNHCNCYTKYNNFHKIGRFGQWRRGILTNHAYEEVRSAL